MRSHGNSAGAAGMAALSAMDARRLADENESGLRDVALRRDTSGKAATGGGFMHRPIGSVGVAHMQRVVGNRATTNWVAQAAQSVQRQPDGGVADAGTDAGKDAGAAPPVPQVAAIGKVVNYVVRDSSIGVGGTLVPDLAALKTSVMTRQEAGQWSLMLSIHGSGDRLAAQAPPNWQQNAVFYNAGDITTLFGDKAFVDWRDKFGPQRVVLVACQVSRAFEQTVANALTRGGQGISAGGLGPGCKPIATKQAISWALSDTAAAVPYTTRAQYNKLSPADKAGFENEIRKLNQQWGYFGAPPVPDADLLRYYFDEEPRGYWVQVEVNKQDDPADHEKLRPLGVPYYNRWASSTFMRECDPMSKSP